MNGLPVATLRLAVDEQSAGRAVRAYIFGACHAKLPLGGVGEWLKHPLGKLKMHGSSLRHKIY